MIKTPSYISAFTALGQGWSINNVPMDVIEQFICQLYQPKCILPLLTDVHHQMFMEKFCLDSKLPPTMDELMQHTKIANYQAAILCRSLEPIVNAPCPIGYGWVEPNDAEQELSIQWMTKSVAPPEVLELIYCYCWKTKCITGLCSCHSHNFRCGPLCKCHVFSRFRSHENTIIYSHISTYLHDNIYSNDCGMFNSSSLRMLFVTSPLLFLK